MRETCNYEKEIHQTSSLLTCNYHEKPLIFAKKDNNKTWLEWSEKWSEQYTCKGSEDEVKRKGHLTKLKEVVVHMENVIF